MLQGKYFYRLPKYYNTERYKKFMFMKAAIIEDNAIHADLLGKYLLEWSKDKQILLEINKYKSAENFLFEWEPGLGFDVLFIDIQMEDMNGMEMAKSVRKKDSSINIVFTTGITGYIEEGYEVEALHYLIKPVNKKKLHTCMDKVFKRKNNINYILVHSKDETIKILTSQINYIEARGHNCVIEVIANEACNRQKYLKQTELKTELIEVPESISELETLVMAYSFIKCHRSYLCNIQNIHQIGKTEITFDTGSHIPVSRRLHKDVNQAFIKYFSKIKDL